MRKGMWSVAAVMIVLLSGAASVLSPDALAADTRVAMGSESEPLKFHPAEITVPVGATVEWHNDSDLPHDVNADDGSFASDPSLGRGEKFEFRFTKPGEFRYFCAPHKDAGMTGVVRVTGAAATPTTVATTTTTAAPAAGGSTTTTKPAAAGPTTTTKPAAGGSTTTTTAGLGVTSTTQAPATTPTSAPDTGDVTSTTTAPEDHGDEEAAVDSHGSEGGSDKDTNPVAVGLAGILTAVLTAVSLKLLTGKP